MKHVWTLEEKRLQGERVRKAMNNPEVIAKMSKPRNVSEKFLIANKNRWTPERKRTQSAIGKLIWERSGYKEKQFKARIGGRKGWHQSEESKRLKSLSIKLHNEAVKEEANNLVRDGFTVVTEIQARPDIIARKDGKVYAVEVEFSDHPNFSKYDGQTVFDDVKWIRRRKK